MNEYFKKAFRLFFVCMYISAFTFGGGFVIVTFMKKKFVDELGWISEEEMLDFTSLAQSSPGAIAVNAAILVGWKVAGFFGMALAVLGTILPPMLIISVISLFYEAFAANEYVAIVLKSMQAGVAAVIFDVVFNLGSKVVKEKSAVNIIIMVAAFLVTLLTDINVVIIILLCAIIGVLRVFLDKRKGASQ